jgi:hypothetical protein
MPWKSNNPMRTVVLSLLFTAVVLVLLGTWLLFTSRQPLIGALVIAAGALDALMAWGISQRR